jgi:signal transduction histidine kinase
MTTKPLISPEILVPRLGDQLVETGLLTARQLQQALEYQEKSANTGYPILLGQAFIEMGFLDRPTLDRAVTEQIMSLRSALVDANRGLEKRVQQRTTELENALRQLEELNQLKANFIANVSHELRTPLTHILGYMELLQSEALGELTPDQKKAVDVSTRSANRLQSLINDLILFSMASRGELNLVLRPVNFPSLASAALEYVRSRAEAGKISLQLSLAPQVGQVNADQEKISWVLIQLLENAVKFTRPGGKVRLSAAVEPKSPDAVTVMVADNGIGIPPERVKEIFQPFYQLDSSATRQYGGTGLGLALVQEIVKAHGSIIIVNSVPDKGTAISFPLLIAKRDGVQ